jgi:hypothetical protein
MLNDAVLPHTTLKNMSNDTYDELLQYCLIVF